QGAVGLAAQRAGLAGGDQLGQRAAIVGWVGWVGRHEQPVPTQRERTGGPVRDLALARRRAQLDLPPGPAAPPDPHPPPPPCLRPGVARHHLQNRLSFSESSSSRRLLPSSVVRSTASAKQPPATACARTWSRARCAGSGALVENPVCSACAVSASPVIWRISA